MFRPSEGLVRRMGSKADARAMGGIKGGLLTTVFALAFVCYDLPPQPQVKTWKQEITDNFPRDQWADCVWIIMKESNGNETAVNGSHYGLAQGRSKYLKSASVAEQINWFRKYIQARYKTCTLARRHHERHNWY